MIVAYFITRPRIFNNVLMGLLKYMFDISAMFFSPSPPVNVILRLIPSSIINLGTYNYVCIMTIRARVFVLETIFARETSMQKRAVINNFFPFFFFFGVHEKNLRQNEYKLSLCI